MMIFTMVSVYILYGQTKGRKMKRILLTGASGFIGKNIKETLNSKYDIWSPFKPGAGFKRYRMR